MVVKDGIIEKARRFLIILCGWLFVALLISSTSVIAYGSSFNLLDFLDTALYEIICLSPWILLTPFLINIARKYRFDRYKLPVFMGVHLGSALVIFSLHTIVQSYASYFQYNITFNWAYLGSDFLLFLDMRIMLYLGVLLIIYIVDFEKRDKETQLKKVQLQNQLNHIKIQVLVNKFQPVFFMNCIDAIQHFLKSDAAESENILNNFSDLLRIMLRNIEDEEITVQEGLESLYLYLDVLESRLGREIERDIHIDNNCLNVLVPLPSAFIPIMEKVLEFVQENQGTLFSFSYKAVCEQNQFKGAISLGIQNIPHSVLIENLEETVFKDLNEYLKAQYGEDGCLQIDNKKEGYLRWVLRMPLTRQSPKFTEESR